MTYKPNRHQFWTCTRFLPSDGTLIFKQIELNTKNSTKRQQSCRLVEFLVFNSAFGRHRHWWIPITSYSYIIIDMSFIIYQLLESDPTWQVGSLSSESIDDMTMMMNEYDMIGINQCLCLPKAELNTKNSTSCWLSFWCSTRLLMLKKSESASTENRAGI